jgi:hypothetical protein
MPDFDPACVAMRIKRGPVNRGSGPAMSGPPFQGRRKFTQRRSFLVAPA